MTDSLNSTAADNTQGGQQQPAGGDAAAQAAAAAQANQQQPAGGDATDTVTGGQDTTQGGQDGDTVSGGQDDGNGADGKPKPKDGEATKKAPEKYELNFGEGVKLSPEAQTQFEAIARELDLPQESAQKLAEFAPHLNKMYASQLIETAKKTSNQWAEATKADEEIGGKGDEKILSANLALAAKARDAFATPELLKLLAPFDPQTNPNGSGFGNHPEVVRLFTRLGKSISEDNKLVTGQGAQTQQSAATKLYGNTTKPK